MMTILDNTGDKILYYSVKKKRKNPNLMKMTTKSNKGWVGGVGWCVQVRCMYKNTCAVVQQLKNQHSHKNWWYT